MPGSDGDGGEARASIDHGACATSIWTEAPSPVGGVTG
jgi:hypothetical protein